MTRLPDLTILKNLEFDHLKELGITHVHILPSYDYASVDETKLDTPQYNWGYDPQNYNVPDGSYSTDPYKPEVRIREFKQMVQSLHKAGIRVIMDVVYNHTFNTDNSNFQLTVPGYFYRFDDDGTFANGSGCGNETASDREMVRKYIVESVKYWVNEYHVDGFRFDLMGIHDIETMKAIRTELDKIDPSIFIYGEGDTELWETSFGEHFYPYIPNKYMNVAINVETPDSLSFLCSYPLKSSHTTNYSGKLKHILSQSITLAFMRNNAYQQTAAYLPDKVSVYQIKDMQCGKKRYEDLLQLTKASIVFLAKSMAKTIFPMHEM